MVGKDLRGANRIYICCMVCTDHPNCGQAVPEALWSVLRHALMGDVWFAIIGSRRHPFPVSLANIIATTGMARKRHAPKGPDRDSS